MSTVSCIAAYPKRDPDFLVHFAHALYGGTMLSRLSADAATLLMFLCTLEHGGRFAGPGLFHREIIRTRLGWQRPIRVTRAVYECVHVGYLRWASGHGVFGDGPEHSGSCWVLIPAGEA